MYQKLMRKLREKVASPGYTLNSSSGLYQPNLIKFFQQPKRSNDEDSLLRSFIDLNSYRAKFTKDN